MRQTADQRRESVLAAATAALAAKGLYGSTTEQIARQAGISQPDVFRLFGSKTNLFIAVLTRALAAADDHGGRRGDAAQRILLHALRPAMSRRYEPRSSPRELAAEPTRRASKRTSTFERACFDSPRTPRTVQRRRNETVAAHSRRSARERRNDQRTGRSSAALAQGPTTDPLRRLQPQGASLTRDDMPPRNLPEANVGRASVDALEARSTRASDARCARRASRQTGSAPADRENARFHPCEREQCWCTRAVVGRARPEQRALSTVTGGAAVSSHKGR